jgi:hypothetical protein
MCGTCIETDLEPAATWTRAQIAEVTKRIRVETLQRNRMRPEPWPICIRCEMPVNPTEADDIYRRQCVTCGLNKLEQLFRRLTEARGRRRRRRALKRIARFAKTGK